MRRVRHALVMLIVQTGARAASAVEPMIHLATSADMRGLIFSRPVHLVQQDNGATHK
jgi:hypothetical protein